MSAYRVTTYRGTRNWHRRIADYAQIVTDGDGKPPAREQAETLRQELAERSQRQDLGWTHINIQPTNQEQPS